jgi:RimJ/RimL family protein N-acetyltransferase
LYNKAIVPEEFQVPEVLESERLRLRPLTVHDAVKDFDAVMTSAERLQTVFDPGDDWPSGLTLEQNLIELAWHQAEFQLRTSFAYTVVSLDESQVLGCFYIYPTRKRGHDVEITMWVRQSEAESGLDEHLFGLTRFWIEAHWPFANPAYPGRTIDWDSWRSLPED